jgi:hypothetical protein
MHGNQAEIKLTEIILNVTKQFKIANCVAAWYNGAMFATATHRPHLAATTVLDVIYRECG